MMKNIGRSSSATRCTAWFSDGNEDTQAKVIIEESGWAFASVPAGETYLSYLICSTGFLQTHPELKTRELKFSIPSNKSAAYFGHINLRFNVHGLNAGAFGLVGATAQAVSDKGSDQDVRIRIADRFSDASYEFQRRFGSDGSFRLVDATMVAGRKATK